MAAQTGLDFTRAFPGCIWHLLQMGCWQHCKNQWQGLRGPRHALLPGGLGNSCDCADTAPCSGGFGKPRDEGESCGNAGGSRLCPNTGSKQSQGSNSSIGDREHHGGFLREIPAPVPGTHRRTKGTSRSRQCPPCGEEAPLSFGVG